MNWCPYLAFNGNCREAMTYYAELLGAEITYMMDHKDMPPGEACPPGLEDKIMHARIELGEFKLMASDAMSDMYQAPQGICVQLSAESPEEAERLYNSLKEGGKIVMELQETFWARKFAVVTDRFGTPWMINCEHERNDILSH